MTDGEIFYHIRNGIRNTSMPAWSMPEQQIWQLILYIRNLPITVRMSRQTSVSGVPVHGAFSLATPAMAAQTGPASDWHYVGSTECKSCHAGIYGRWKKTPMANVVRDPREHPDAIIPDLSKSDSLLTFTKDDIAFVYGSIWKQRYFKKVGDDYFPEPAQWDVTHKMWRQYFVKNGTDWWAPLYPPDNFQRPTGPLCDDPGEGEGCPDCPDPACGEFPPHAASETVRPMMRATRRPTRHGRNSRGLVPMVGVVADACMSHVLLN